MKIEKSKKEIEKLENRILVSAQSIETISEEIIRLREAELYPQLLDLVNGLVLWLHLVFPVFLTAWVVIPLLGYCLAYILLKSTYC